VEASQASVPLLLLTADRAPESRRTGANQAIPQPGLFGAFVRHAADLPCPTDELPVRLLKLVAAVLLVSLCAWVCFISNVHTRICIASQPFFSLHFTSQNARRATPVVGSKCLPC
jgi:2-succinyl-5-enolpyruvyl-6-hydroxy-3-cyclohexene-1-carboxylate synthase